MIKILQFAWLIVFVGGFLALFIIAVTIPKPRCRKLHHKDDAGYDAEIVEWNVVPNDRYAGNFLQKTHYLIERKTLIKDAHKVVLNGGMRKC